jgi:NAD(P)-dependent dehydrogenase (short-subunit alcohol dehydrogenase family)
MIKSVLITGANAGLGKEAARQLALAGCETIYLGCRNPAKAEAAKRELQLSTRRSVFETLIIDVMNLDSVRKAVAALPEPVEGLILNAGGMGGKTPGECTSEGATHMFAVNVLGHTVLLDELMKAGMLTRVALYSGSEAARGIPMMKMKKPEFQSFSVDEFASVIDGSFFGEKFDPRQAMGYVKYLAALWMASAARQYPDIRFVTMSPGGSAGSTMSDTPPVMRFVATKLIQPMMKALGRFHDLETGAKRYVDGLNNESFRSGAFYASKFPGLTGALEDQSTVLSEIGNQAFQDNANKAIHRFIQ